MSNLKTKLILINIVFLAFCLRFYDLGNNPPSINWDEAAHGYNAYSILKTGKDEFGDFLPLAFRSFDDYKPPLYIYLVIPSVTVFGLNDFAVRFPSAIFGVATVFFTFLLALELLNKKKIAVLASFLLAISPWHLQFSRVAFENNVAVFFIVFGSWAFLKSFKSSNFSIFILLSSISFSVSLFLYQTPRLFTPLLSLLLLSIFYKELLIRRYRLIPAFILVLVVLAIFIPHVFSQTGLMRFKGASVFQDKSLQFESAYMQEKDKLNNQEIVGRIVHNRRFIYIPKLLESYFSHFNPAYLFFTGDSERHHAPQIGVIYLWSFPFIVSGIYALLKNKFDQKSKLIIFGWFLLAAIPAAVTIDVPHAHRTEVFLPIYQIFTAIGLLYAFNHFKKRIIFALIFLFGYLISIIFYLHQYHFHLPLEFSKSWMYGRKEAAIFSNELKDNYDRVVISTNLEKSNLMWLYYLKYDPVQYLNGGGTVSGGFLETENKFDKFFFKPIDYQKQKEEAKTLFVGQPQELGTSKTIIKKIFFLSGEPAIYIAE